MEDKNYTVLHLHSDLSNGTTNIDSVTKYNEYVDYAASLGMKALAFSEHGNIFEWYHKKCAIEDKGMKYIHACEVYVTESLVDSNSKRIRDNYHCLLIALNFDGFKELNKLVSRSFNRAKTNIVGDEEHFYYYPRITFDELISTSNNIVISTACIGSILGKGNDELKNRYIKFLFANKHRCFLEIQPHLTSIQIEYNKYLYRLHKKLDIPLVACTDTHALNDTHVKGRKILQQSKDIHFDDEDGWDLTFKTYDELVDLFTKQNAIPLTDVLEAIENTNKIANLVKPFELDRNTKYPKIYNNSEKVFKRKINEAYKTHKYLKSRYPFNQVKQRLNNEMEVYKKTKSIDFMLLQNYIREWERENDIQCGYGRGSVTGSEIAYTLGITQMDSMKFDLNFFRFMNPSRVTNADIDSDYSSKDREKVKYFLLHDHMNLDNVKSSEIITFNTIALKGAIRDACRGLYFDNNKTNDKAYLKKADYICNNVDLDEERMRKEFPEVFEYVDIINGTIVSIGTHPSGVLVSDLNIEEMVGLCSLSTSDYPVSMLNMKELDALMYVKLDILGLDNIGVINDTCKMVGIERLTPDNVDLNDEAVWKSIRDDTTLIFQWESDSAQAYLKKFMSDETLKIAKQHNSNFSYIKWFSFGNGLIRPGCKDFRNDVANGFIYDNHFKELDEFLSITFGHVTMQEDIMQFLVRFCGYSDAESDTVRRGIAKKYGTEKMLPEIEQRFIEYSSSHYNISKEECAEIIKPFLQDILSASSYAFSWNHSDTYSCIGYICGYLRYYYPVEFVTCALNIFKDNEEKTLEITKYAQKNNIAIKGIQFRYSLSEYTCNSQERAIYKGISSIKYLNEKIGAELYSLKDNMYETFIDLLIDIDKTSINSRQLEILVGLNFFQEFGEINNLLFQVDLFSKLYGKKQLKKDRLVELGLNEELVSSHCGKETEKQYTNIDSIAILKEVVNRTDIEFTPPKTKIMYQIEYLGYVDLIDKNAPKNLYVVTNIKGKKKKKVALYEVYTGKTREVSVWSNVYSMNPFDDKKNCVLTIYKLNKKNKVMPSDEINEKTGKPKWKSVPNEYEFFLDSYKVEKGVDDNDLQLLLHR